MAQPVSSTTWFAGSLLVLLAVTHYACAERTSPPARQASEAMITSAPDAVAAAGTVVFLSDLQPRVQASLHGGLGRDRPYWQPQLVVGNRLYAKGLVTHPEAHADAATVEYALDGKFDRFLAVLGSAADDTHGDPERGHARYGDGTMTYAVRVDGAVVSKGRFPQPPATLDIDVAVSGGRVLRLEVRDGDDGNWADHAAWADARLVRR